MTPHLGYNLKNANCSGGYMADVFAFTAANGTATESLYPYTGKNVTGCKAAMLAGLVKQRPQGLVKTGAAAPGYLRVPQGRTGMLKAIAQRPVAAYMAIDPTFQVGGWVGGKGESEGVGPGPGSGGNGPGMHLLLVDAAVCRWHAG